MSKIRWGIIGCGDVTEIKSGPGFTLAQGSELVAVMRRDEAKAQNYAQRHNVACAYGDADQLINDPAVDAVYIATPPGSHEEYALRVCAAKKPCYVEKPMSRNAQEARRMQAAFEKAGVPLFVAYYRRALPRFLKAHELITSGQLGKIQQVDYLYTSNQMREVGHPVPWRVDAEHAGAGLFLDLGSHTLDLMDWFFGPLQSVQGDAKKRDGNPTRVEDLVEMTFSSPACAQCTARWDFLQESRNDWFTITGELATLRLSCFGQEPAAFKHKDGRVETFDLPNPKHVQQPLIQIIVDRLLRVSDTRPDAATASAAVRTQAAMDVPLERFYRSRGDGFWENV